MDGLIVIDKPVGPTSHDIVQKIRKLLGIRRIGHGGTLDPGAAGVLLITVGQATRFFPYLSAHDKSYDGMIRFGFATDTYDSSGRQAGPELLEFPPFEAVAPAMKAMEGEVLQVPPPYSAKKVGGTPGYRLARAGKEFALKPVPVRVRSFEPIEYRPPMLAFRTSCSSGTYIRSMAHDLGRILGCAAHLHSLRRTAVGPYVIEEAVSLPRIEEAVSAGLPSAILRPLEDLLPDVPAVIVRPQAEPRVRCGAPLSSADLDAFPPGDPLIAPEPQLYRLFDAEGRLLALAKSSSGQEKLLPCLVLNR